MEQTFLAAVSRAAFSVAAAVSAAVTVGACSGSETSTAGTTGSESSGTASAGGAMSDAAAGDAATCDPSPPSCVPTGQSCPGGSASCCQTGAGLPVGAGCVAATGTCVPRCNSSADCGSGSCCIHNSSSVPPAGDPPGEPGGWCLTEAEVAADGFSCMAGYGNGYICEGTYVCGYTCSPADAGPANAGNDARAGDAAMEGGGNEATGDGGGQSLYGTWIYPFTNSSGGAAEYVFIFNADGTCEGWLLGASSTAAAQEIWIGTCEITAASVAITPKEASCPTSPPVTYSYVFDGQYVLFTDEATGQVSAPFELLPAGTTTLGTGLPITTGCLNAGVFTAEAIAPVN